MFARKIQIGLVAGAVVLVGLSLASGRGISFGLVFVIGFLVVCPLIMVGMHGGGHNHGGDTKLPSRSTDPDSPPPASGHVH
jgi:hypothetical protein